MNGHQLAAVGLAGSLALATASPLHADGLGDFMELLFLLSTSTTALAAKASEDTTDNAQREGARSEAEWNAYVAGNSEQLAIDFARGRGPHLGALVHMTGCPASAVPAFGGLVQSDYERFFPDGTSDPARIRREFRRLVGRSEIDCTGV